MASDFVSAPDATVLQPHLRWRPDWTYDRPCLYWYLTFDRHSALTSLWRDVNPLLVALPGVHAVPRRWLHLTVAEVGFADALAPRVVASVLETARAKARECRRLELTLGPVTTMTDAVVLSVAGSDSLTSLRDQLRRSMPAGSLPADLFHPHVTVGYVTAHGHRDAVMQALGEAATRSVQVKVPSVALAVVSRRTDYYRWEVVARLPLGRYH